MNVFNALDTCSTSSRVGWNAELARWAPRSSTYGVTPRSLARLLRSRTKAAAPIPSSIPLLRASNGTLTSSTTLPMAWAPAAANPGPNHVIISSLVASSALTMMMRSQRPVVNQSSAMAMADGVEAQALLIAAFGPRAPIHCANCEWPMVRTCRRKRRSKFPFSSEPLFCAWRIACSSPGKQEAKMTPVRSRSDSGRCQCRICRLPALLICSTGSKGNPASLSASRPAAKAKDVVISIASTIFESTPYCSAKSKWPLRPASCGIRLKSSHGTNSAEPSGCLTIRTMFRSKSLCLMVSESSEMKFSPRMIRSSVSGAKTSSIPGRPKLMPLKTYGSLRRIDIESTWRPVE